jgi:hypothetical protein
MLSSISQDYYIIDTRITSIVNTIITKKLEGILLDNLKIYKMIEFTKILEVIGNIIN